MRLSNYVVFVDNYPSPGEHLVCHTRTQALVKVDQELRDLLSAPFVPENFSVLMKRADELRQLYEMGFFVASREDDIKALEQFFKDIRCEKTEDVLLATVVTTTACNFKCVYCFEEPSRENTQMNMDTAVAVIAWLQKKMSSDDYQRLHLIFYGGEPLLNEPVMQEITLKMGAWCVDHQKGFRMTVQTNGYLMTPEKVEQYRAMGMTDVRISLDGVGAEHDKKRPLRAGGGTFEKIMENIEASADRVRIGISVSYDKNGTAHVAHLLDYLEKRGLLHKLGKFLTSPVHPPLGAAGQAGLPHCSSCPMDYTDVELVKAVREIDGAMIKKGLPVQKGLMVSACSLVREHGGVTIDAEGRIYGCNAMIGHPEFSVGDIYTDKISRQHEEFVNTNAWSKCPVECPYLPLCAGGCRLMSFLKTGKFDVPDCRRDYLDQVVSQWIKREYDDMVGNVGGGPERVV